jgi:osmotically-inducible protein OsmY
MQRFVLASVLLLGCAHADDGVFTRQYVAVRTGAQNMGRSGPHVIETVARNTLQITDTRTKESELAPTKSDAEVGLLKERVEASLANDRKLRGRDINVRADEAGTVTLSGHVGTPSNEARAVQHAVYVSGVHVVNTDFR